MQDNLNIIQTMDNVKDNMISNFDKTMILCDFINSNITKKIVNKIDEHNFIYEIEFSNSESLQNFVNSLSAGVQIFKYNTNYRLISLNIDNKKNLIKVQMVTE